MKKNIIIAAVIATMSFVNPILACTDYNYNYNYGCDNGYSQQTQTYGYGYGYGYSYQQTQYTQVQPRYCQYCGYETWNCQCQSQYQQSYNYGCDSGYSEGTYYGYDSGYSDCNYGYDSGYSENTYDSSCNYGYDSGYSDNSCSYGYSSGQSMAHWANIRDEYGNIIGVADAGNNVEVIGQCSYDASRTVIYDYTTGTYGTVSTVYLYGGSDYEYENPTEYGSGYSGNYQTQTDYSYNACGYDTSYQEQSCGYSESSYDTGCNYSENNYGYSENTYDAGCNYGCESYDCGYSENSYDGCNYDCGYSSASNCSFNSYNSMAVVTYQRNTFIKYTEEINCIRLYNNYGC